jgi:ATP-dependent helicase/nuclease subunit A
LEQAVASTDTPFMLFQQVLQQSRRAILERLGQEAEDASQEFLTLALDYEQLSGISLSGFLDWFSDGDTQIKREMEQGSGQLRLMTVHGSKGLEAPIVFLADAADPPPSNKDRLITVMSEGPWRNMLLFNPDTDMKLDVVETLKEQEKQAQLQERLRLLYVGMTRAADELYICGSVNKDDEEKRSKLSWHVHVEQAFVDATGLTGLVRDETQRLTRFGAAPELLDKQHDEPVKPEPLPGWATTPVAPLPHSHLPLTSSRSSDAFDKQAVAEGIATHRLIELMADAEPELRLEKGRHWASRFNLPTALAELLNSTLAQPDLLPLFGPDGQSEVAIEGEVPGLGRISGRIDRMAIGEKVIWILALGPVTVLPVRWRFMPPCCAKPTPGIPSRLPCYGRRTVR